MSYALALERLRSRPWQPVELDKPVSVDELPTPALVLEAGVLKRNLARMQAFQDAHGKGIRPHAKTHKSPVIAHLQIEGGAVGVCAAKVSEAAALVFAGVGDVLITSPVVSPEKIRVVAELLEHTSALKIVVDHQAGLDVLRRGLPRGARIGVLIDVDVSMGRTGVRGVESALALARAIAQEPNLELMGVQHYAGQIMHVKGYAERRERSHATWAKVEPVIEALARADLAPRIVTGGGTGTYNIDCDVASVTDLQVGSYVVMDRDYRDIGGEAGESFDDFEVALTVAATAISEPVPGRAVTLDAGFKAFASDSGVPVARDLAGTEFRFGGDEHGILVLGPGSQQPLLGGVHRFVTPHCDPTVNLHDWYWIEEPDGLVRYAWPITARGCSW